MANWTLQKAKWTIQILRVSFPTAFSRNAISRSLNEVRLNSRIILLLNSPRLGQTRSVFRSTKLRQDLEAKEPADYKVHRNAPTPPHSPRFPNTSLPQDSNPTEVQSLTEGFNDSPLILDEGSRQVDWARSFHGLSTEAFPPEAAKILRAPLDLNDVEVKPDGIVYLPEIKYRRVLNNAFGPGAWGLAPRGETIVTPKSVTREYALVVLGRSAIHLPFVVSKIKPNSSFADLFPLREVNRTISTRKPSPPPSKVASPMR